MKCLHNRNYRKDQIDTNENCYLPEVKIQNKFQLLFLFILYLSISRLPVLTHKTFILLLHIKSRLIYLLFFIIQNFICIHMKGVKKKRSMQ